MILVEGKKIAERIKGEIKESLKHTGPKSLAIFYVGENPVIDSYVALKKRVGEEIGIEVVVMRFPDNVSEEVLIGEIKKAGENFSGIIVQLPIPEHLDKERVLDAVQVELDVDVLSREAHDAFASGLTEKLPPVVGAVKEIFDEYKVDLSGKKIVVVGKGLLVGKPVLAWLSREGLTSVVVDRENSGLESELSTADVVIAGAGVPALVRPGTVKDGAILIDAGTSTSSGKIVGDIDRDCYAKASLVSPVPGGVGPITVVRLFKNLFLK